MEKNYIKKYAFIAKLVVFVGALSGSFIKPAAESSAAEVAIVKYDKKQKKTG